MKQRAVIVFGNKVFQESDKVFEKIGKIIVNLSKKFELVLFYDHSFCPENVFPIAIKNAFLKNNKNQKIASIDSKIIVDRADPAFKKPTTFIGPSLTHYEALKLAKTTREIIKKDKNGNLRRLVPSLKPIDFVEKREIVDLLSSGAIVITSGETVAYKTKVLKLLKPANAVVDRDVAAEKLAEILSADYFISVTDVENVYLHFSTEDAFKLRNLTPKEAIKYLKMEQFSEETIGKKIESCIKIAKKKKTGIICSVSNLEEAIKRQSGTIIE